MNFKYINVYLFMIAIIFFVGCNNDDFSDGFNDNDSKDNKPLKVAQKSIVTTYDTYEKEIRKKYLDIESILPADNKNNVNIDSKIIVTLNRLMTSSEKESITNSSLIVSGVISNKVIDGSFSTLDENNKSSIIFKSNDDLNYASTYKVVPSRDISRSTANVEKFYTFNTKRKLKQKVTLNNNTNNIATLLMGEILNDDSINKTVVIPEELYNGKRSFSKQSSRTVKDNYTGLIWQNKDDGKKRTWSEAMQYCKNLELDEHKNYRLPAFKEIFYITDKKIHNPAIDLEYFTLQSSLYWTSQESKSENSGAWGINLKYGNDYWISKLDKILTICVKDK